MPWYIVQALSGYEEKVKQSIFERVRREGLEDKVEQIFVPTRENLEVKGGKKIKVRRNYYPGYVFINAEMMDELWHLIKKVNHVVGFLGGSGRPRPVPDSEVKHVLQQMEQGAPEIDTSNTFEMGESIKVIDGPFESFTGVVEENDADKKRLKVAVSIFGRATPVELDYSQVEKVES